MDLKLLLQTLSTGFSRLLAKLVLFLELKYLIYFLISLSLICKIRYVFNASSDGIGRWNANKKLSWFQRIMFTSVYQFAKYWNGYEVHFDNCKDVLLSDDTSNVKNKLLIGYHSRPTLDLVYLVSALQPKSIVFHFLFDIPFAGSMIKELGGIPSTKSNDRETSRKHFINEIKNSNNQPLMLLPGGIFELSKQYEDRFKVTWLDEPGFAQAITGSDSIEADQIAVIPFYTNNCELSYKSGAWWYNLTGRYFRSLDKSIRAGKIWLLPLYFSLIFLMLGFLVVPWPVKMDTYFSEPIYAKKGEKAGDFAERVKEKLQQLIDKTEAMPERPFPMRSNFITSFVYGSLALFQNLLFGTFLLACIWAISPFIIIYSLAFKTKRKLK